MVHGGVAIVGAGLGGLCAAALAADAGLEPTLFDTAQSPGGVARTVVEDGLRLEPGASTLLVQEPALADVVRWSGAATSELTATDRWVFLAGRGLRRLAPGPGLLLRPPGSRLGEVRALITAFRATPPSSDVSLEDYCRSHFGAEYGRLIAWLVASGVYAGDPSELSARACLGPVLALESAQGGLWGAAKAFRQRSRAQPSRAPRSVVAVGGMADLADRIVAQLGDSWRPQSTVVRVDPPHESSAGRLTVKTGGGQPRRTPSRSVIWAAGQSSQPFSTPPPQPPGQPADVAVVFLAGQRSSWVPPHGMGVLVGPDVPFQTRGILFESEYTPPGARCSASQWLLKVIFGGKGRESIDGLTDDQIAQRCLVEIRAVLDAPVSPDAIYVLRRRIPQYVLGIPEWRQTLTQWSAASDVHLTGWESSGVGVRDLARNAAAIVADISSRSG